MSELEGQGNAALVALEEAERLMKRDHDTIEQLNKEIKKDKEKLYRDEKKLKDEINNLKESIKKLEQEKEHVEKLTSSSRDARKMYGDMTPGDTTHQDVTLAYQNHFKSAQRNMPKKITSKDKYEVWQGCAKNMQDAFEVNRERLIQNMVDQVQKAVLEDHKELDETTYDLQRAFEMFLHSEYFNKSETEKVAPGNSEEESKEDKEVDPEKKLKEELVMDMLKTLHPDDYIPFITEGKLRKRKLQEIKFDQEQ